MATPPNPRSRSDIGPISDTTGLGESGETPASKAADTSSRQSRPDSGQSVVEPELEPTDTDEPLHEANGAIPSAADSGALKKETPAPADANKPPSPGGTVSSAAGADDEAGAMGKPWPALNYSRGHEEVEQELRERLLARYGTFLVRDMEDAQYLLSYVTRNGLDEERKVTEETIQTVIACRENMRNLTFDSKKEEAKFRKSCGVLAKAAEPVTAASLRDSLHIGYYRPWLFMRPRPTRVPEIACRRYRAVALAVLAALLVFQIYWTAVSSILAKTEALISELNKAPTKQYYLAQEKARLAAFEPAPQPQTSPSPAASPASGRTPATQSVATEVKVDKSQLTLDELVSKSAELDANYSMLEKFLRWWPLSKLHFEREKPAPAKAGNEQGTPPPNPDAIFVPSAFQDRSASARAMAGQVIDVMQKWVLPLLYGALGAAVFVIRTLSVQARDRLFRTEALVSLVLRVFLGMISGLAIGWFWNQSPAGATTPGALTTSTLSPFALAFVAGYGVELFFALLDKIVSTFTNK